MKKIKKLYLVKREVVATSVREALKSKGIVYSVELTKKEDWPEQTNRIKGFSSEKEI